jgi:GH24 family phage-related lysozyme (muramidase)
MDRPHLRYIEAGNVAPTPSIAAVTAPGKALGEFGEVLSSLGDKGLKIAEQIRETREADAMSTWRTNADERASKFSDSLLTRQDPDQWLEDWNPISDEIGGQIDKMNLSPSGKARAKREFDEWAADKRAHFSTQSTVRSVNESKTRWSNNIHYYAARGDAASARRELERGRNLVPASQYEELEREITRSASFAEVKKAIDDNPLDAPARIAAAGEDLTMEDRRQLTQAGEIAVQTRQKDSLQTLSARIARKEFPGEEDLKRALQDNPYIEPGLHDEVIFHYQQSQPVDAETRYALTDQLNDLHDDYRNGKLSMDHYRAAHDEIAQVIYAMGARDGAGGLRQRVHLLDPATWNGEGPRETPEQARLRDVERLSAVYQKAGAYGSIGKEENLEPHERAAREVESMRRRERVDRRMEKWVLDPANAGKDLDKTYQQEALAEVTSLVITPPALSTGERRSSLRESLGTTPPASPPGVHAAGPATPAGSGIKELVKRYEAGGEALGFHPKAYWDNGQWSIGYGTKAKAGEVIDQAEAERRLDVELAQHRQRVEEEARRTGMTFEPHELDALTSFDFNTGSIGQLLAGGTRSKAEIASKMLLYRNSAGQRLRGLERRRIAESTLFRRGYTR